MYHNTELIERYTHILSPGQRITPSAVRLWSPHSMQLQQLIAWNVTAIPKTSKLNWVATDIQLKEKDQTTATIWWQVYRTQLIWLFLCSEIPSLMQLKVQITSKSGTQMSLVTWQTRTSLLSDGAALALSVATTSSMASSMRVRIQSTPSTTICLFTLWTEKVMAVSHLRLLAIVATVAVLL